MRRACADFRIRAYYLARDLVSQTHVSIAEIDDYKDVTRERLLGGGTLYEFRLSEFSGGRASGSERP